MKNHFPIYLSTIALTQSFSISAIAMEYERYQLKKGDVISEILYEKDLLPLYGKKGYIKKVVHLNAGKVKKNGDLVNEGDILLIPMRPTERKVASENVEVIPPLAPLEVVGTATAPEAPTVAPVPTPAAPVPTPAVACEPTQVSTASGPEDKEQYTFFRVMPQVSWLRVNSTSSNTSRQSDISALSKASPGLLMFFGIKYDDKIKYSLFSYISQINFYSDSAYDFKNRSFFRTAFGGGVDYEMSSTQSVGARAGLFDEFFLTSPSAGVLQAKTVQIPEVHFSYRKKFMEYKKAAVSYAVLGKAIIPYSTPDVKGKFGYGLGADLLVGFKGKSIRFFYNYSQAKATGQSTTTNEIGWNAIFETHLFE